MYHEVLIAGDLSREDLYRAAAMGYISRSDTTASNTAEFVHGNETVYFAQPSPPQFAPGGSGTGNFNPPANMGLKGTPNNTPVLTGRNAPKSDIGAVLRYAPVHWRMELNVLIFTFLDTPSGESGSTVRGCLTLKSTCEETWHTFL